MTEGLTLTIRGADFLLKHFPKLARFGAKWMLDKRLLKEVTSERIKVDSTQNPQKVSNSHTILFLNQVIRSAGKVSRKSVKGGKQAKITKPQLPEEKALITFHFAETIRRSYIGQYTVRTSDGTDIRTDDKLEEALFKEITKSRIGKSNEIYYLQGHIGCGKSTLLSTLVVKTIIARHRERESRSPNTLQPDICIVSFENFSIEGGASSVEDIVNAIKEKIVSEIQAQVDVHGRELKSLLVAAAKDRQFTLILDGLDFLYTAFCRLCFELENNLTLYYKALYELVGEFTNGDLSDTGINIIIAFRNETLDIIKNTSEELSGVHRVDIPAERTYSLHDVPKENLIDVFNKRVEHANEEGGTVVRIDDERFFHQYHGIAIHGLRHIMDTWEKSFGLVPLASVEERLYRNSGLFKVFFLTSGLQHYSQVNHGLTNIYLVNPSFRSECGDVTVHEAIEMDRLTYWLKYLILVYIVENNTDRNTVIDLFTKRSGYSANLIRIITMGFSEVEHGRVLKPTVTRFNGHKATVVGLEATSRGKRSLSSGLFFSFEYLCCVVEDTYLRVPSSILKHFEYPQSIRFLGEEDEVQYQRKKFKYLLEKASSVFAFIVLLEEAYHLEKKRDPDLFKLFESERYRKYIPDFLRMREDALRGISNLAEGLTDEQKKDLKDEIVKRLRLRDRELIRRSLFTNFNL